MGFSFELQFSNMYSLLETPNKNSLKLMPKFLKSLCTQAYLMPLNTWLIHHACIALEMETGGSGLEGQS